MDSNGLIESQDTCIRDYQKAMHKALEASETYRPGVAFIDDTINQRCEMIKIIQEVLDEWEK